MNTIPKDPDPRNVMYVKLVTLQLKERTESEIAAEFEEYGSYGSAQEVFAELQAYGFPVCEVCGANPVVGVHCPMNKPKARRMEGEPEELPSIRNAATTFRDTIRTLEFYLEQSLSLKEVLQGRYFVGEGETEESNTRELRGAQWHPHPYVVVLIAVSILEHHGNWGYVERLLKELHLRPAEANRRQLVRFLYGKEVDERGRPLRNKDGRLIDRGDGLLDRARQVAALIRGKLEITPGRKGPAIPPYEQFMVLHTRSLIEKGLSREEIMRRDREEFERWKEASQQDLRDELEAEKATLDHDAIEEYEREIRRVEEEQYDEDEFYRMYALAKDLK